jgi:signal transduction histidine kinase
MTARKLKSSTGPKVQLDEQQRKDASSRRQVALLSAIIRIFRETMTAQSEEEVAQVCLVVAEDLTASAYSFMGELSPQGLFNTTTISEAGWKACQVPRPEADQLLKNMPNHGVNRIGLLDQKSWIINDVERHPRSVAKPQGHPQLTTFMGVPILYTGGIIGMIGLAGKLEGYTVADQEDVEALSVAFIEALNRRRAERQVELLNQELTERLRQVEAANKELEAFSYSVSHDLRAPVRHISGYLELLDKKDLACLDEKSRHYLQVVAAAAQKMGILIDGLLAFSRLGRAEVLRNRVDLNQMVKEVVQEQAAARPGREIHWEIGELPVVVGDRVMLHQVMTNLIENALKFSQRIAETRIEIGADYSAPDEMHFYVKDNGVGFDMRYMDKLFGLFQRLHAQEDFEGTGVGLATVQRIILRHGGRTWAEGELGKGATFWFSLPKNEEVHG